MIRKLMKEEYKNAINLSYQVCIECGINDFTEEGIETFKSFVYDTSLMNTLDIYGAFDNHLLIGIIGVHRERQHISLFFVLPRNDDAPTSVFTPEALKQTTWQAQMTVYNIEDEIDYTKQSILQFTNESEGIYTRTNEEDGYMWNTDFTYQVNGKIITFDNIAGPWTVLEYTGTHLVMEAYNPNKMVWTLEKMY